LSGPALTESAVRLQGRPVPPRPSTRLEKAGFVVTVAALLLALLLLAFL
jgi:hypothetical protein